MISELFDARCYFSFIGYELEFLKEIIQDFQIDVIQIPSIDFTSLINGEGDGVKKFFREGMKKTWHSQTSPVFIVTHGLKNRAMSPYIAIRYFEHLINLGVDLSQIPMIMFFPVLNEQNMVSQHIY